MRLPSRGQAGLLGPIPVFVVVMLLALLLGGLLPVGRPSGPVVPVVGDRPATTQEIRPTVDPPRFRAVDVCLAIDDSNSEYDSAGSKGSDPDGERYAAARQMLAYLVALTPPQNNVHKVAVVHFGSRAEQPLPLTAVTGGGADAIQKALQLGPKLGATNYPDAIRTCRQTLAGEANPVIVVVGDGDPDLLDGRPLSALFADITRAVTGADVPVHVLLTIRGGVTPSTMELWKATGVDTVADIGVDQQLQQRVARHLIDILGSAIGALPRPLGTLDAAHKELPVDVPEYAPSMTLTSFAEVGSVRVRLRDPSGAMIVETEQKGIVVVPVPRPAAGRWQVELVDGGPAKVQVDIAPLQARLLTPPGALAVGRPLTVSAAVGDGGPLPPALYVGAVVETAGKFYDLQLKPDAAGIWRSVDAAPITQDGPVNVRLLVKNGPDTVLDSSSAPLQAALTPYLVPDASTVLAGDGAQYGWRLHQNGQPVSDRILGEAPRAAVTVRIGDGPQQQVSYQTDGYWTIPASSLRPGQRVDATLSSRLPDGTAVVDTASSTPVVVQPVMWVRGYRALTFAAVAFVLILTAWLAWLLVNTRTPLDGYLRESSRRVPTSNLLRIRRRRWVRTSTSSSRFRRVVWLQRGAVAERTGLVPWPLDARPSNFTLNPPR